MFQNQNSTTFGNYANPIHPAYLSSGWDINPNLLTPSYMASYRPAYDGGNPYTYYTNLEDTKDEIQENFSGVSEDNYGSSLNPGSYLTNAKPGFFRSASYLPLGATHAPQWGLPTDHMRPYADAIGTPVDAVMRGMQRVVAPIAAYGLAYKALGTRSISGMFTGKGIAGGIGAGFGRGLSRGLGLSPTGIAAKGLRAGSALAASVALPLLAAQGALTVAEDGIFDPYIQMRKTAEDLRRSFEGITFAGDDGDVVTGAGLSRVSAAKISNRITSDGISDRMFSMEEFGDIADATMRTNLVSNVNMDQLGKRFKDVAEQVKLLSAVLNNPDYKAAIEELSKLHLAGASVAGGRMSVASGALRNLSLLSSAAGMSVQRMMDTVGAQGQYMFQSNGMTPYLGQLAQAQQAASFMSAHRVGMISQSQAARLGGIEGAIQSAGSANITASQTMLNKMGLMNKYVFGASDKGTAGMGRNRSLLNTVATYGENAVKDPLGTYGRMLLYSDAMAGQQIAEQGNVGTEDQVTQILKAYAITPMGENGRYSVGQAAAIMHDVMNMAPDQINAWVLARQSEQKEDALETKLAGFESNLAQQRRALVSQQNRYTGFIGKYVTGISEGYKNMRFNIANATAAPMAETFGKLGDWASEFADDIWFGQETEGDAIYAKSYDELFSDGAPKDSPQEIKFNRLDHKITESSIATLFKPLPLAVMDIGEALNQDRTVISDSDARDMWKKIETIAEKGNQDARMSLSKDFSVDDRRDALLRLSKTHEKDLGPKAEYLVGGFRAQEGLGKMMEYQERVGFGEEMQTAADAKLTPAGMTMFEQRLETLSETTGLGNLESLKASSQATEYMGLLISGASTAKRKEYLEAAPELKQVAGDGKDAEDKIRKVFQTAGTLGLNSLGAQVDRGPSIDQMLANPKLIKDESIRKEFMAIAKDKDTKDPAVREKLEKYALLNFAEQNAGKIADVGIANADKRSDAEVFDLVQQTAEINAQRQQSREWARKGMIDFQTDIAIQNQLDQKQSIRTFADAVQKFKDAVGEMGKDKGFLGSFFGGDKDKDKEENSSSYRDLSTRRSVANPLPPNRPYR
jgi:hypothetical protein